MTEPMRMQRSSRDSNDMRQRLQQWLAEKLAQGSGDDRLEAGTSPVVSDLAGTEANGMSSDTILFTASWTGRSGPHVERLVARVAPDAADVPVFPAYDLPGQFAVIRAVSDLTDVPVPRAWWCEPSSGPLGAPFFVMSRVDGLVPPDVMPYTFGDNWLYDATPEQRRRLQETTIEAIASLHDIDGAGDRFEFLDREAPGDSPLRRHVAHTRDWYDMVAREGAPSALVERGFDWLDAHWPGHESTPALSWGDARIGNVLYDDFTPAALLDWEMAGLGPPELDVAWIIYAHLVFQSLAEVFALPGLPDFMTVTDVTAQYEKLRGYAVRDLRFYLVYAAVQWGIVFLRTGQRQAHFGEREMPADPQDLLHNRPHLESLLADVSGIDGT
jgi:aminoglycoside phosphotransferase (APT) family kinase protein